MPNRDLYPVSRRPSVATLAITLILLVIITLMVIVLDQRGLLRAEDGHERESRAYQPSRLPNTRSTWQASTSKPIATADLKRRRGNWLAGGHPAMGQCATSVTEPRRMRITPAGHPCLSERCPGPAGAALLLDRDGTTAGSQLMPYTSVIPLAAGSKPASTAPRLHRSATSGAAVPPRYPATRPTWNARSIRVGGQPRRADADSDAALGDENAQRRGQGDLGHLQRRHAFGHRAAGGDAVW